MTFLQPIPPGEGDEFSGGYHFQMLESRAPKGRFDCRKYDPRWIKSLREATFSPHLDPFLPEREITLVDCIMFYFWKIAACKVNGLFNPRFKLFIFFSVSTFFRLLLFKKDRKSDPICPKGPCQPGGLSFPHGIFRRNCLQIEATGAFWNNPRLENAG